MSISVPPVLQPDPTAHRPMVKPAALVVTVVCAISVDVMAVEHTLYACAGTNAAITAIKEIMCFMSFFFS